MCKNVFSEQLNLKGLLRDFTTSHKVQNVGCSGKITVSIFKPSKNVFPVIIAVKK